MILPFLRNTPLADLSHQVSTLSKGFLDQQGLNYFHILRCYADGSIFCLSTNPCFMVDWFTHNPIITLYNKEQVPLQNYSFLLDEILPKQCLDLMATGHSLYSGVTTIYRYEDYYDLASFTMPEFRKNAGSYYLSSMDLLDGFYQDFLTNGSDMITTFEKEKIILPREKQDKNVSKLILSSVKGAYYLQGSQGQTYITARELMVLNLLKVDKSVKDIARMINLSPIRVEDHIYQAQRRTGMDSPYAIIQAARQEGFKKVD